MRDIFPPSTKRVERNTKREINEKIRINTIQKLNEYKKASYNEQSARIYELNHEWDTERILEANAAAIVFISTMLGFAKSRYWFIISGIVGFFLFQHAAQGWCPPIPIIRRLGVRTPEEILSEKTVLKFFRGDFDFIKKDSTKLYDVIKK